MSWTPSDEMSRRRKRVPGPPGILLIDKPSGSTSASATRTVGRRFKLDPVGHTGTLDPAATGLLVVCTGYATRLVPWLQEGEKVYMAVVRFGAETSTCDAEGEVTRTAEAPGEMAAKLREILPDFTGIITQVPPVYSAIRVDGRRAHSLARDGVIDEDSIPPREVTIHALDLQGVEGVDAWLHVTCSPGTYIRTLAVDLGAALGSAAHLLELRRLQTGGFDVADAVSLDDLLEMDEPGKHWRPVPDALPSWRKRQLDEEELAKVLNGGAVDAGDPLDDGPVLLVDGAGEVVAVGEVVDTPGGGYIAVRRLLRDLLKGA